MDKTIAGDSMQPTYRDGDVIFMCEVTDSTVIDLVVSTLLAAT